MRSFSQALSSSLLCLLFLLVLPISTPLSAQTVYQPDFVDVSALTITPDPPDGVTPPPTVLGGELRLTENLTFMRGGVFKTDKIAVDAGFETSFTFRLEQPAPQSQGPACPVGKPGGDGLAFVVQNHSLTKLGSFGFAMGYGSGEGPGGIQNSVAIELDSWQNIEDLVDGLPMAETDDNHTSVQTLGASPNSPHPNASLASTLLAGDLNDGASHNARVSYSPGDFLRVEVDGTQVVDLPGFDFASYSSQDASGDAWVGFTAATGACYQIQILEDWVLFAGVFENGFEQGDLDLWSAVEPSVEQ